MGPLITPLLLVQTNVAYHRKKTASMMKLKVVRAARESRLQEGGKGEWGMGEGEWGGGGGGKRYPNQLLFLSLSQLKLITATTIICQEPTENVRQLQ